MHDPLDLLAARGLRVIWADDLQGRVLLLPDDGLVVADAGLSRTEVAVLASDLLREAP